MPAISAFLHACEHMVKPASSSLHSGKGVHEPAADHSRAITIYRMDCPRSHDTMHQILVVSMQTCHETHRISPGSNIMNSHLALTIPLIMRSGFSS